MSMLVDAPPGRAPLTVEVRRRHHLLELTLRGSLDAETGRALVNDLVAAHDPGVRDVHIDLAAIHHVDRDGVAALDRCSAFATARGAGIRITGLGRTLRRLDLAEHDA